MLSGPIHSAPTTVAVVTTAGAPERYIEEWRWALRGGGISLATLPPDRLTAIAPDTALLILDAIPLSTAANRSLEAWVRQGGLVIYSGGPEALQTVTEQGSVAHLRQVPFPDLLGVEFAGQDPGLIGTYPRFVHDSPVISPLLNGDALRLGKTGIDHTVRFIAKEPGELLALGARLSPGPGSSTIHQEQPTLLLHQLGEGRVLFVGFSLGRVAACYPGGKRDNTPLDCSGASNAHALMRWLTANLLWEQRRLQVPLLWEAPGDRPHAVIITGDVHDNPPETHDWASVKVAEAAARAGAPLSLYLEGRIAKSAPDFLARLKTFGDLEIYSHGLNGKVYLSRKYIFRSFGILYDLWRCETLLGLGHFPMDRSWLSSRRSHGWISDRGAWSAMRRVGIGLAFDQVADSLSRDTPWRVTPAWFVEGQALRLYVPLFEHSVSTAKDDFLLDAEAAMDIANLASAQPEPVGNLIDYSAYTAYVRRWHDLLGRLATVGGLSEVWLWHPEGVMGNQGLGEYERTLRTFRQEPGVTLVRGDVVATWRANRERLTVRPERDPSGRLTALTLQAAKRPLFPLPPHAPTLARTTSYWVLGPATLPGWASHGWTDPLGRTVTVLTHSLDLPGEQAQ